MTNVFKTLKIHKTEVTTNIMIEEKFNLNFMSASKVGPQG